MNLMLSTRSTASALALACALGGGCATAKPGASSYPAAVVPVMETAPATVAFVNEQLRFVVVDFGTQLPPAIGTRLAIYRSGRQIGSIVITEPVRGRFATADIVAGTAQRGDTVAGPAGSSD